MPKVLVVDPATSARDGWHEIYGSSEDALNGNVSRVFLAGVPQTVPTSMCRQPDDWSCGPYSLAECLGQANGEDARRWLLARGLITPEYGTEYSGIVGYLGAQGYSCSYDGRAHDGEMHTNIFQKIINHLQAGYKVILCMHGTSKGCRTNYWTRSGHYICVYGIDDIGPSTTYSFRVEQVKEGDTGKYVMLGQKLLKSRGMYNGALDQSYGPQTKKAVLDYQKYINKHGGHLTEDGILGPATWTNIIGISGNVKTVKQVKAGDKSIDVFLAQQILAGTGYYKGALDKSFGPATEKAVKAFQKDAKIKQDGVCGPESFRIMIGVE